MTTTLPPDIAEAINLYRHAVKMYARAPLTGNAEAEGRAYRVLNAAILRHLPRPRPELSAEDAEALRMGGDR